MTDPELLDSAQVAERLGVTIDTVYKLRVRHPKFPTPVRYDGPSPLYSSGDLDEFIASRSSGPGRRPRTVSPGVVDETTFAERLRRSIADGVGAPKVTTQAQLIELLGLNVVTFGQRMRGRTRWRDAELETIGALFHLDVDDANAVVDAARAAR